MPASSRNADSESLPEAEKDWLCDALAVLPGIAGRLRSIEEPVLVMKEAVRLSRDLLGFRRVGIWLLENEGASAVGTWGVSVGGDLVDERGQRIFDNSGFIRTMLQRWKAPPHYYEKARGRIRDADLRVVGEGGHVTAPLMRGEAVFGFVAVDGVVPCSGINQDTGKLLVQLGQVIASAYEVARLKRSARAANERAKASERIKSEFLGMFGHEIRTPLNAIIGCSQLICMRDGVDIEVSDLAATIKDCGAHLSELVETIMGYAHVSEGDLERWASPGDPISVIESTMKGFGAMYAEAGLELSFVHEGQRPLVLVDAVSLRQVLTNLLQNALKFTRQGGVRVGALSRERADGSAEYYITVADTGIGIESEFQEIIFEPFRQLCRKESGPGGIGMGLAVVRKLVEHMGGRIRCESQVGKGTTFSIEMQFESAPNDDRKAKRRNETGVSDPALASRRILIVDDNELNLEVLRSMAKCLGYLNTEIARDGEEARELLMDRAYDLVLVDLQMPRIDGLSLTRLVRGGRCCPLNQRIPIVGVTAYTSEHDREECLMAGMNDYIAKPIEIAAVQRALGRVLK